MLPPYTDDAPTFSRHNPVPVRALVDVHVRTLLEVRVEQPSGAHNHADAEPALHAAITCAAEEAFFNKLHEQLFDHIDFTIIQLTEE